MCIECPTCSWSTQSKCLNTVKCDLKLYLYKDTKNAKVPIEINVPIWEIYTLCDIKLKITKAVSKEDILKFKLIVN